MKLASPLAMTLPENVESPVGLIQVKAFFAIKNSKTAVERTLPRSKLPGPLGSTQMLPRRHC